MDEIRKENHSVFNTLIVGLCISAAFYIINRLRSRKFNEPPLVPYKYPIIGSTWDYCAEVENFLLKCRKEYGAIFRMYVYGRVSTVVGKELSHEVFNSKDASFNTAFEDIIPVARILGIPHDYLSFTAEIAKNVFTGQMHLLTERVQRSMHRDIDELIGECDEPKVIQNPRKVILATISNAITNILVGEESCRDEVLVDIFMNFSNDLHDLLHVPKYLRYIHPWLFQQYLIMKFKFGKNNIKNKQKIVIEKIKPIIEARLEQERKYGDAWKPPVDCIQFLLDQPNVDKRNMDYVWISGQLLGITFAAITTTVNATSTFLLDFGSRPEYWNDLIEEQEKVNPNNDEIVNLDQVSKMEKMDSFLKECIRLTGSYLSLPHKIVGPVLKFSNGYQVPNGRTVFIYVRNVHYDEETFGPDPNKFEGFRYLGKDSPASRVSRDFLHFGMGRHACPGRNFAINEIKLLISILIKKYKITTKSGTRPANLYFDGMVISNPEPLIFEKRVKV